MIDEYFYLALNNLKKRKVRSWLTVIGIFISIATIFVLVSLSIGLQDAVEEQFRLFGTDKFFVQPRGQLGPPQGGGAIELTTEDVETIEKVSGVREVTYFTIGNAEIEFNDEIRYFAVYGMPIEGLDLYAESSVLKMEEGRLLEEGKRGEIVIGYNYKARNIFQKPVSSGDKIIINEKEFKVKGIFEEVGNPEDDRNIILGIEDFRELFDSGNRADFVLAQIDEGEDINEVADRVERRLQKSRNVDNETQDFTILTPEEILESFGAVLNIITGFLIGVAAVSLIVGGIGIANTMYASVLERTKEIGVMKSIGARNYDVFLIFVIESALLGLVGGIVGIIIGFGISKGIEYVAVEVLATTLLQAAAPLYVIAFLLAFAFLSGAISGALPAYQAARLNPVDALRYE